ncbi:hypothetical protein L5515_009379 [Caenorhabditis briggsae]|uniref:Lin-15A/B-like domain-containing protein n=1 Tax=Caenorhabditis briggsae TaxID=6238 RepID=A0AAE9F8P7_CAEBR|nr:hypothetical protein L5515_009379 [Caenorhabditis briggsae]
MERYSDNLEEIMKTEEIDYDDVQLGPADLGKNVFEAGQRHGICQICQKTEFSKNMKRINKESDRLVIGSIFQSDFASPEWHDYFLNHSTQICLSHLAVAMQRIRVLLENPKSIENWKTERSILSKWSNEEMLKVMTDCERRNQRTINEKPQYRNDYRRCAVCNSLKGKWDLGVVKSKNVKMIIMLGCVLNGSFTYEDSQDFVAKPQIAYVCHSDFLVSFQEIIGFMKIDNVDQFLSCSKEDIQSLMEDVTCMCPEMKLAEFARELSKYSWRIRHFTA